MRRLSILMLLVPILFLVGCSDLEVSQLDKPVSQPEVQPEPVANVEILVFTAKWCPACQRDKPHIDALRARGAKITIIDADERPDVVRKYRVRTLPTYIVLEDGVEVQRTNDIFLIISIVSLVLKLIPIVWPLLFG